MSVEAMDIDQLAAELKRALRHWRSARAKSAKAAEARASFPPGSSRARVTTANARWARAAEDRERAWARVNEAIYWLNARAMDVKP